MPSRKKKSVSKSYGITISNADITISGNAANSMIAGDPTTDAPPPEIVSTLQKYVERRKDLNQAAKVDLKSTLEEIMDEASKGDKADPIRLERHLRHLLEVAPDVFDVAVATLTHPMMGMSTTVRKIVETCKKRLC